MENALAQFLSGGLASLLGALFGVLLALQADRVIADRKTVRERRSLVDGLVKSLNHNKKLLHELRNQFDHKSTPTFGMDVTFLEATSLRKHYVGIKPECCGLIDDALYELQHLNNQLTVAREVWELHHTASVDGGLRYKQIAEAGSKLILIAERCIDAALADLSRQDLRLPTMWSADQFVELLGRSRDEVAHQVVIKNSACPHEGQ